MLSNPQSRLPQRVLIVDDDSEFADSVADLLWKRGYEVEIATNPDRALAALHSFEPAVVLLDIRLGRFSGLGFLSKVVSERHDALYVMITAQADVTTAIAALRLGAYDYYEKSLPPCELEAILGRAFERWRLVREREQALRELRLHRLSLDTALDHMSQGMCIFDAMTRLVICNRRYRQMYDLSAEMAAPGCTLLSMLNHRTQRGTFVGDPQRYCFDLLVVGTRAARQAVEQNRGRTIFIVSEPLEGGGWVVTHDDVTERRLLEQWVTRVMEQNGPAAQCSQEALCVLA